MFDALWKPAAAAGQFASDDLDEVREHMDGHNGAHWRHAHRPAPIGFRLAYHELRSVKVAWCGMEALQTIRGSVAEATAHLTLAGRSTYRFGRRELDCRPGDLVLLPAGVDVTIEAGSLRRFVLQVPVALLAGGGLAGIVRLPSPPDAMAALRRVIGRFAVAARLPDAGRYPALAHVDGRLADWLQARMPRPAGRRTPRLATERVRRIEEWIDAHLQEPLSLTSLSERAGVQPRCLQVAFQAYRRQSPLEFVAERRLAAAHEGLVGGRFASVTEAASAFGFEHPGRFAATYRRMFGLNPSEALRRGLGIR